MITLKKPRIGLLGFAVWLLAWCAYTLMMTTLTQPFAGNVSFLSLLKGLTIYSSILMLMSIPIWYLVFYVVDDLEWRHKIFLHLALGALYTWVVFEVYVVYFRLLLGADALTLSNITFNKNWLFYTNFLLYTIQFSIFHATGAVSNLREKERQTADLLQLARDQELAALKAQINPHFLFNTLNNINAMIILF